jgi:serine/threonine protein kinase/tetratricopeptide (TPR) repeat protein
VTPAQRYQRAQEIFNAVIDREPGERTRMARELSGDDEGLLQEVLAIVRSFEETGGLLAEPLFRSTRGEWEGPYVWVCPSCGRCYDEAPGQICPEDSARLERGFPGPALIDAKYRVERRLGSGGMGDVFVARHVDLDRDFALKLISGFMDVELIRRFQVEARALGKLKHSGIVQVTDYGVAPRAGGMPYLVMEYLEGVDLGQWRRTTHPNPAGIVAIFVQIAEALDFAHSAGILHRDIKPANILVVDSAGKPAAKVLDFGIAKMARSPGPARPLTETGGGRASSTIALTAENTVVGTPQYMAPEQLAGQHADARTDIFAFGAVLYEMLAGRKAFEGPSRAHVIAAIIERDPPPLPDELPAGMTAFVARCLAKNPDNRWQSARDLKLELEKIVHSNLAELQPRPRRSWRTAFAALALVIAFAAGVLWFGTGARVALFGQRRPSIAVLPFKDLSPGKDQADLADGLPEELKHELSKNAGLLCIAVDSRDKKPNIGWVLDGSVRRQGSLARISVELIHAADGAVVWSHNFDREMIDLRTTEADIARNVHGQLKITLLGESARSRVNGEAHEAYLRGNELLKGGNKDSFEQAIATFQRSSRLDPKFAEPWTGMADAHLSEAKWGLISIEDGYKKARDEVEHSLSLDPDLAEAHVVLGDIQMFRYFDWAAAEASYNRARELEPGNGDISHSIAMLRNALGRSEEAIALLSPLFAIDPTTTSHDYAMVLHYAGRNQEAADAIKRALAASPKTANAHSFLGRIDLAMSLPQDALTEMQQEPDEVFKLCGLPLVYYALGRKEESDASLQELIAKHNEDGPYQIADVYAFRGETGSAFNWLERAVQMHDAGLTELKTDPLMANLRKDPRYAALLEKLHLPL